MAALNHASVDEIARSLEQLEALLCVAASEAFTTQSERVQQNYLWACNELASSPLANLFNSMDEVNRSEVPA